MKLGYHFTDESLLELALTHRSAGRPNNERLEFLGDALVNLVVAEMLFDARERASEGELSRLRAHLVSEPALAERARGLRLGDALKLGSGELKSGGFRRDSILADAFEALVAAIYLDGGWDACRGIVRELFAERVAGAGANTGKDAKTRLQELLQGRGLALPVYALVATAGADHAKVFDVECDVSGLMLKTVGRGASRRAAEQVAATAALAQIEAAQADAG